MNKICADGRISGQTNKEAGNHLGILTSSQSKREKARIKYHEEYIKKGYNCNSGFKKGHISWSDGKHLSNETKEKIRLKKKGSICSIETKKKMREKALGRTPWNKGKKSLKPAWNKGKKGIYSDETIRKMVEVHAGSKSHFWKGGKSFEPYSIDWTSTLKISIKERDRYTCQVCMKKQGDIPFNVHHADYDKKNCNPDNLITLCNSCHSKTGFNRKHWQEFFCKKLIGGYDGKKDISRVDGDLVVGNQLGICRYERSTVSCKGEGVR